ncbi:hypothetical protein Q3G72_022126 [Acer saccharum]|nr:hypothetical protein Q3G72_022126 [Acer saccharum]
MPEYARVGYVARADFLCGWVALGFCYSGTSTLSGPAVEISVEDSFLLSRPVPIFDPSSSSSRSLPPTTTTKPLQVYSRRPIRSSTSFFFGLRYLTASFSF